MDESKVIKSRAFRWEGVQQREYKTEADTHRGVSRQTLLGDQPGEAALHFLTRYFEVQPGGFSSLELHAHPHAVVVVRGSGTVLLGNRAHDIAAFDCVYVAPGTPHQFRATGPEPLGFLCMVDRERDRPVGVPADPGAEA